MIEWISVTDRLPEVEKHVVRRWCEYDKSIKVLCLVQQNNGKRYIKDGYCEIYTNGVIWRISGTADNITYWAYMPPFPEENI